MFVRGGTGKTVMEYYMTPLYLEMVLESPREEDMGNYTDMLAFKNQDVKRNEAGSSWLDFRGFISEARLLMFRKIILMLTTTRLRSCGAMSLVSKNLSVYGSAY